MVALTAVTSAGRSGAVSALCHAWERARYAVLGPQQLQPEHDGTIHCHGLHNAHRIWLAIYAMRHPCVMISST